MRSTFKVLFCVKKGSEKPTDIVRLCANDIMTRLKLKSYQDTYAAAKEKAEE